MTINNIHDIHITINDKTKEQPDFLRNNALKEQMFSSLQESTEGEKVIIPQELWGLVY